MRKWLSLFVVGLMVTLGCTAGAPSLYFSAADSPSSEYRQGQIIETATGQPVSLDRLIERLLQQDVVYLGEEHHNRSHIEAALSILRRLTAEGRQPVLAMEMFGWDGQADLDRYLSGELTDRKTFLEAVGWQTNWGGPFEDYEPLVDFAKQHRLTVKALNPPKPLVRLVARQGLAQARRDADMARWQMQDEQIVDDPTYRERILEQLKACHGGGSDGLFQTMYEASMFRDEGMAKTIVAQLQTLRREQPAAGPVVSYTGGGHVQYNLPVPKRVARRLSDRVRQVSVYMTSYEPDRLAELQDMVKGPIADYVWLTAVGPQGPPKRCR